MSVVAISNPKDKDTIKKMMDEISNSYTRIKSERDLIKDTIDSLSEEYEIDKKHLNKMARAHHKQNYTSLTGENEDFEFLFENIFGIPE
jgi:uncharacterized FlgJ-related protein